MGTQISANYDNVEPMVASDIWTVHTGVHKVSKEVVCLWAVDVAKLKEKYRKKAIRNRYLDVVLASLQQMRKYRHPRILKVLEIVDKKPEVGFSSEPFTKFLSTQISNIHPMDVAYISYQIAEVFNFLSNDARIVHLGLNPTSILLDDQMSIKLTQFQWASPFDSNGNVTLSQTYNDLSKEFGDNYYKAPEMLNKSSEPITNQADVFIFGLFLFEALTGHKFYDSDDAEEILNSLSTKYSRISAESKIPPDFITLLKGCLNPDPSSRPTFSSIITSPAYQSMQLKSLRYIDVMLTKNPSDKFAFYKGLSKKVDEFSPSLQRIKILPTMVNECIADVRFAPILIGAIFKMSVNFTPDEFMNLVWKKLSVLATVIKPPEVSIALLRNITVLMEKVDKRLQKDYVYPIIFSALNSQESRIHSEVLQHIDVVIEDMSPETIRTLILPRLLDLAKNTSNASVVSSSLACIVKSLRKVDNEAFCVDSVPKIVEIWRKLPTADIASCVLDLFVNLKIPNEIRISRLLPVVCEITVSSVISPELRYKFCNFIIKAAEDYRDIGDKSEKNFNDQTKDAVSNELNHDDNPFASAAATPQTASSMNNLNPFDSNKSEQSNPVISKPTTSSVLSDMSLNPFDDSTDNFNTDSFNNEKSISQSAPKLESNSPFASAMNDNINDDIFTGKRMAQSTNNFGEKQFTTSNSNDNLSQMKNKAFNADSVFGSQDNSTLVPPPKRKTSTDFFSEDTIVQPATNNKSFTSDIFNSTAYQNNADDIFNSNSSASNFPPSKSSANKANEPIDSIFGSKNESKPSTDSVFSNRPQSSSVFSSSPPKDVSSQNQSIDSLFGSSSSKPTIQQPVEPKSASPIDSLFGPSSNSASTPVFSTSHQASTENKSSGIDLFGMSTNGNNPSGLGTANNNSGGFGDTSVFNNRNPITASDIFGNSPSSTAQSSTDTMSQFGSGGFQENKIGDFNQNAMETGGFDLGNGGFGRHYSTPSSTPGFPNVQANADPYSFNPFQNDSVNVTKTQNLPPTPPSVSMTHGAGFNPFQDANGGGVVTAAAPNSSGILPSGRMVRTVNGGKQFQIGNQTAQNKPAQSQSTDLFDLF